MIPAAATPLRVNLVMATEAGLPTALAKAEFLRIFQR